MIVGFSKHGTGKGSGAVDYITSEQDKDGVTRKFSPEVIKGDTEQTRALIDSLNFKYKYTSGVLSFAPGETITPEMEEKIISEFESCAFSGLEQDQYNISWVRHTHADHHELHFVVPRVELVSGKSLNIAPPGKASRELFDTFRSKINAEYGLADPDDPARARNMALPDHIAKIRAKGSRDGKELKNDVREAINGYILERVEKGLINSRDDVVAALKESGFNIPREGKNYITVEDTKTGDKFRMKGGLYDREEFNNVKNISSRKEEAKPDPEKAAELQIKLNRLVKARAKYNRERYGEPDSRESKEHDKNSISGYIEENIKEKAIKPERGENDRVRTPFNERLKAFGDRLQQAGAATRAAFERVRGAAGNFFSGAAELEPAGNSLGAAGRKFEQSINGISESITKGLEGLKKRNRTKELIFKYSLHREEKKHQKDRERDI